MGFVDNSRYLLMITLKSVISLFYWIWNRVWIQYVFSYLFWEIQAGSMIQMYSKRISGIHICQYGSCQSCVKWTSNILWIHNLNLIRSMFAFTWEISDQATNLYSWSAMPHINLWLDQVIIIKHRAERIFEDFYHGLIDYLWNGIQFACIAALILGFRPANDRRRYKVTPLLIGWAEPRISTS